VSLLTVGALGCTSQTGARTFLCAGDTSFRAGRYDEATAEYSRAIRDAAGRRCFGRENLVRAYLSRGTALERQGKHGRAVADYGEAASLAFWSPAPYLKRADLHARLGRHDKAAADYTQAIQLRPAGPTYAKRALAYRALGKIDLAEHDEQMARCILPPKERFCRTTTATAADAGPSAPVEAGDGSGRYAAGMAPAGAAGADEWAFNLMPYVWVPDVEGNATVQGVKTPANWGMRETFRNVDWTTAARLEAWKNGWGLIFDALYVKAGGSNNHPLPAARSVNITVELLTIDLAVARRILDAYVGKGDDADGTKYPRLVVEPLAGARYVYLNQEVEINANVGRVQDSEWWVEPFVGGRVAVCVTENVAVQVRGDIGGFGVGEASKKTWSVIPGVLVRVSDRIAFLAAYRITAIDYKKDSGTFANDATLKGPMVGVGIDF